MKRLNIVFLCLFLSILPCNAESIVELFARQEIPNVFIYHIPDEETPEEESTEEQIPDIISDDVTADTSPKSEIIEDDEIDNEEIKKIIVDEDGYQMDDMYSDVLKGYASYTEDEEDMVTLDTDRLLNVQIQRPYNFKGGKYLASKSLTETIYSKLFILF